MNIQLRNTSLIVGRQGREIDLVSLFQKGSWLVIVVVSIVYSVVGLSDSLLEEQTLFEQWVYVYLNFLSFVLGVIAGTIIFHRKLNSWMAYATSVMLITFTATDTGLGFWYHLFTKTPLDYEQFATVPFAVALFISVLYMAVITTSLAFVLLTFPDGKMPSNKSRWFFNILIASQIMTIAVIGAICLLDIFLDLGGYASLALYLFLNVLKGMILLILCLWPIRRLRRTQDPVQRQQVKWIVMALTAMAFFYAIESIILFVDVFFSLGLTDTYYLWLFLVCLVFTYAFIVTLFMAILRYRLWDMGVFVNRALVYSSLTAVLGVIGFAGGALLQIIAEEVFKSNSPLIGGLILLPLAAIFNPVRDSLQGVVDRHLKPEEIDFSSAIVEIAPDAQLMLSSQDILKILVRQTREQLNLSHAAIYLPGQDGQLTQAEPSAVDPLAPQLSLDEKTHTRLELGEVVVPADGSPFSLYIPLVIKRASRPDFLGLLVFGPRNNGEGYSTPVIKSLCKLGCDAGKAIYLARLREDLGQNVMQRLAAIERGLSTLRQSGESPSSGSNTSIFPA